MCVATAAQQLAGPAAPGSSDTGVAKSHGAATRRAEGDSDRHATQSAAVVGDIPTATVIELPDTESGRHFQRMPVYYQVSSDGALALGGWEDTRV